MSGNLSPFHFAIVGGGTAGWMAALLFAHKWLKPAAEQARPVQITLIESP